MKTTSMLIVLLFTAAIAAAQSSNGPAAVICESTNGHRHVCNVDITHGISLARQLSAESCVRDRTWGVSSKGIWVDHGCRAEFVLSSSVPLASPNERTLVCESLNGNVARCPIATAYGVRLTRQLGRADCALGRDWGFDKDGIWVKNDCRAEFTVGGYQSALTPAATTTRLVCESGPHAARNHCAADTTYGVMLARQLGGPSCVRGETWGTDGTGIWVSGGCRAEFEIGPAPAPMTSAGRPSIVCESLDGSRTSCAADTTLGVTLASQLSATSCVLGQTWGYDANGVWVSGGCRARFILTSNP